MDFATRDRYRHAVEGIARRSHLTEYDVARKAVQLAENHAREKPADRAAHVGYFLVDRGRPVLERLVEMRLSGAVVLDKLRRQFPLTCYLSAIGLVTIAATTAVLDVVARSRQSVGCTLVLLAVPVLICASSLGSGIVNWLATQLLSPQSLPRMDFEQGIPAEHRTLVAVPTMLTSAGRRRTSAGRARSALPGQSRSVVYTSPY